MKLPYDDVHLIADPLYGYLRITLSRAGDLAGARQRDAQVAVQRGGDEVDVVVGELHRPKPTAGARQRQGCGGRMQMTDGELRVLQYAAVGAQAQDRARAQADAAPDS